MFVDLTFFLTNVTDKITSVSEQDGDVNYKTYENADEAELMGIGVVILPTMAQLYKATYFVSVIIFLISSAAAFSPWKRLAFFLLFLGTSVGLFSAICRLVTYLPFLCMFQEPFLLPAFMGVICLLLYRTSRSIH